MENSFQTILEQVVLAQNPDLFIYAHKLQKDLIPTKESIIVRLDKSSSLFPQPPEGFKFKEPQHSANIRVKVVLHNKITNQVLLEDGNWVMAEDYTNTESIWVSNFEPIVVEEAKAALLPDADVFG